MRIVLVLGLLAAAVPAAAQRIEGAGRFGLSSTLLAYESGGADNTDVSDLIVGVGAPGLGISLGTGLSENAELGVDLTLLHRKINVSTSSGFGEAETSTDGTEIQALPHILGVFDSSTSIRAYAGATFGVAHLSQGAVDVTNLLVGPTGGIHAFLGPHASIDLFAHALYFKDLGDGGASGFGLRFGLGVSGWFGGATERAPAASANDHGYREQQPAAPEHFFDEPAPPPHPR